MEFRFQELPPEIRRAVLFRCDSLTLTALLSVSRSTNRMVKQIMADKLRCLLGIPDTLRDEPANKETSNKGLVVSSFSPNGESEVYHHFDFNYMESNDSTNFNYRFDYPYTSLPSSAYNSDDESDLSRTCSRSSSITTVDDEDDHIDTHAEYNHPYFRKRRRTSIAGKEDLNAHSKFTWHKSGDSDYVFPNSHYCASLDIGKEDYYGQLVLRISLGLNQFGNTPVQLMEVSQRIDSNWWMEDEYIVHNRQITYRMQVDRITRDPIENQFGELIHRYNVDISEIIFNTGYLLNTVEHAFGTNMAIFA